jgi:hypothetical protein
LIFNFHFYSNNGAAGRPAYTGNISTLETDLTYDLNLPSDNPIKNWNIPISIGEFGTCVSCANSSLWARDVAFLFDKYGINYWTWYDFRKTSYSLLYADGTEKKDLVDNVDRPYPKSSSIAPQSFSFNSSTKKLSLSFDGTGGISTKIYIPYRYYQDNFKISIDATNWGKSWDEQNRILNIWFMGND